MNCIDDELIQKYIDNETSHKETAYIEEHTSSCIKCKKAIDEQRTLAAEMQRTINLLREEVFEIPVFNIPTKEKSRLKHKRKKSRVMLRWSLFASSAACILAFVLFILKPEKDTPIDHTTFFHETEIEFDANRSITQQEIVVKIFDYEGNISEYNL